MENNVWTKWEVQQRNRNNKKPRNPRTEEYNDLMKNSIQSFTSTLIQAEERISKLEAISLELIVRTKTKRNDRMEKVEPRLTEYYWKKLYTHYESPRRREKGTESLLINNM